MAQALRTAWNANRHWLAAGLLTSASLLLLWMCLNWRNEHRGIAAQQESGLTSTSWDSRSIWSGKTVLPPFRSEEPVRTGSSALAMRPAPSAEGTDRQVLRSGALEIIAGDPSEAAEQLRNLATHLSGFVVNSKVSGSDERTRSAQVTMRIPAEHFDEARARVRTIAKAVEEDDVEARDVSREYVDQEATLRNSRAEEMQYLTILKGATAVKDVLEVSSKLAEVRAHINQLNQLEADLRFLQHQVQMSLLTVNIAAIPEARVFGIRWRPLYKAKLSLRGALSAMADYSDSIVELFLNLPVLAMWGFTIVALLKVGWIVLRRTLLLFFPGLAPWLLRPVESRAI